MKRTGGKIVLWAVLFFALPGSRAVMLAQDNKKAEQEVIDTENERYQAFMKGDADALARILANEFTFTNVRGETHTKAELVDDLRSGRLKYNAMNHTDIRVRVYGDAAVLTGRSASTYVEGGQAGGSTPRKFLNVYIKKNGKWRLVAREETPAPGK